MHARRVTSRRPVSLTYIRIEVKKEPDDEELKKKNRMDDDDEDDTQRKRKAPSGGRVRAVRAQGTRISGLIQGTLRTIDSNTGINYLSEH